MKAVQVHAFGEAEVLQVHNLSSLTPDDGQILVQIKAIGVNPVDAYIRSGTYAAKPDLPYTPGFDCAGLVDAVGPCVTSVSPGMRVYTSGSVSGTYAQYCLCTPDQIHPLPDTVTFEQGAALGVPFATAYHALIHKAEAKAGKSVLIHGGSGGVGTAAIQLACSLGMTVFATAGSQAGLDMMLTLGADHVFNYCNADLAAQVLAKTQNQGVDIILEMLANENLATDLDMLAMGGKVVIIGNRGEIQINPRSLMARDTSVHGMLLKHATPAQREAIFEGIDRGLAARTLSPVIGATYPLDQASHAHQHILSGSHQGKIVLMP